MASYEELIKEQDYKDIANILYNIPNARKDNRVLLMEYYKKKGYTLDQAFQSNEVLNYQSVERKARQLKAVNHSLRYEKLEEVTKYKEIGLDIPVVVRVF